MEGFARRTRCVPFLHELGNVGGVDHGLPAGAGQLVQRPQTCRVPCVSALIGVISLLSNLKRIHSGGPVPMNSSFSLQLERSFGPYDGQDQRHSNRRLSQSIKPDLPCRIRPRRQHHDRQRYTAKTIGGLNPETANQPRPSAFATFLRLSTSPYKINPSILLRLPLGIARAVRLRSA
jgi:hypothetical protein